MKKLILCLAALAMPAQALAMSSSPVDRSNQPVDPADLATFKGDFLTFTKCLTDKGMNRQFAADAQYNYLMRDYNAVMLAARSDYNNLRQFRSYRATYFERLKNMAPLYGNCPVTITPLSFERA